MTFRAICVALLITSPPIAGCGTVANLARPGPAGGKTPFGGVSHDVAYISTGTTGDGKAESEQLPQAALKLVSRRRPAVQCYRGCRDVALYGGVHLHQSASPYPARHPGSPTCETANGRGAASDCPARTPAGTQ